MSENTRITCFKITKQSHRAAQKNNKRGSLFLLPCPVSGGQTTVPFLTTSKGGCSTPSRPLLREPHFSIVQARHSPLFVAHLFHTKETYNCLLKYSPILAPCAHNTLPCLLALPRAEAARRSQRHTRRPETAAEFISHSFSSVLCPGESAHPMLYLIHNDESSTQFDAGTSLLPAHI